MEIADKCADLMDLSACWADWRSGLKESVANSRTYYQDETVQLLMSKLDDYLSRRVCGSSPEEELMDAMWEAANPEERKTLATLLLKIAERV